MTSPCAACGRLAFPEPTVCFWCRAAALLALSLSRVHCAWCAAAAGKSVLIEASGRQVENQPITLKALSEFPTRAKRRRVDNPGPPEPGLFGDP